MSEWNVRAPWETEPPKGLGMDERIEYLLWGEGDKHVRAAPAGAVCWGGSDRPGGGRITRWRRLQAVGDVNGTTKGSGARFNAEKPDLSLIPAGVMAEYVGMPALESPPTHGVPWAEVLKLLGFFQMNQADGSALFKALRLMDWDGKLWADCARVFSYGKEKYAAWNWARGMAWSIPLACALRHIVFGVRAGEELDAESDLPHRGHIACNIVMLLWFIDYYPEGDDRPKLP
jgi:hypothetical protein